MSQACNCGETMELMLRPVIYAENVEIDHVPVYTCSNCNRSEVLPEVKQEITKMIEQLGDQPAPQYIDFQDRNEIAFLICQATRFENRNIPLEQLIYQRMDDLLDLLNYTTAIKDRTWSDELNKRLKQLTDVIQQKQIVSELGAIK